MTEDVLTPRSKRVASSRPRLAGCVSLVSAALLGCGGPFLIIPGGELSGKVVNDPVENWSFVEDSLVDLETRPSDPYSVELSSIVRDGRLYLDPAEGRSWLDHIRADPRVRVRFGDDIYPLEAVLIESRAELEGFDPERIIYRLDPRSPK